MYCYVVTARFTVNVFPRIRSTRLHNETRMNYLDRDNTKCECKIASALGVLNMYRIH